MRYHTIVTPEQVRFRYTAAGLATRAVAWTADQAILLVLRLLIVWAFASGGGELGLAAIFALIFVMDFGYYLYCELRWAGQSPGKRLMGLRVVSARGGKLQFNDVLIRNLLRPVDSLPYPMVLGGIVAWLDPLGRRLGDMVAETMVVRDVRAHVPTALPTQQERLNTFQTDPSLRQRITNRITRDERDLIYELTLRRDHFDPDVRSKLFAQAADILRRRLNLPDDLDYLSDEQTIVNLALVIQNTQQMPTGK
ncbi:MAG: RDD family protein [Phycisphaeraceae bacterium]